MRKQVGDILRIDGKREVVPKGAETPLTIFGVGGIGDPYSLALAYKDPALVTVARKIPVSYIALGKKHVGNEPFRGFLARLYNKSAEIELEEPLELITNLKMNLGDVHEELAAKESLWAAELS